MAFYLSNFVLILVLLQRHVGHFIFALALLLKLIYAVSMVSFSMYVLLFGAQRSQYLCYYLLNFDILNI